VGSLTQLQTSVILGSILGDGYLRIMPGRKDAFLEINHAFKAKEYVDWKFNILRSICISEPKRRDGNGQRVAYRFYTRQHPEITELHQQFYLQGKKIIPTELHLDPRILSVWFMDDGSMCRNSDVYLNTQQFSIEDQSKLIQLLKEMGLEARLNRDKIYYRIRFLKSSIPRLKTLLGNHVIPSMKYKLSYNPVETCEHRQDVPYTEVKSV